MVEGEYLIDTNIFLEVLLEQDNKDSCLDLLKLIEKRGNPSNRYFICAALNSNHSREIERYRFL